ncbi:START domain-containing protein 10-like isoform X2 [Rhodnius prolixus]|uniref:START domain-containing protein 10-like isoform X2 n=1 Tax=Rhodnius prolixus TaxID=13249 RepID=UPI003D18B706
MEIGVVRVAEDKDFSSLKELLDNHIGWKLDYHKGPIKVWTKTLPNTNFKMIKVLATFTDISPEVMYDVLHDPEYRKVWDQHMIESHDIGYLNPNNDVGYYSRFLVRVNSHTGGCNLGYISQTDPQGTLPPWLVNRVTQIFGPKMVKSLQKATLGYLDWKSKNKPHWKPWHFPEQICSPRLNLVECQISDEEATSKFSEEEEDLSMLKTPVKGKKSKK